MAAEAPIDEDENIERKSGNRSWVIVLETVLPTHHVIRRLYGLEDLRDLRHCSDFENTDLKVYALSRQKIVSSMRVSAHGG